MDSKGSVQDGFLKEIADKKVPVRISLVNGKEIHGVVNPNILVDLERELNIQKAIVNP